MSLLLLIGGVGVQLVTPLTPDPILAVLSPDEVSTGLPIRIWAEYADNTTTAPLTSDVQVRIFRLDDNGVRQGEVSLRNMAALGEGYYYDWTPTVSGNFLVTVAAEDGATKHFVTASVTARPKFDPVALALHDTLVARN